MSRLGEEHGFTIVEVMVAVVILLTGILGTLAMLDTANRRTRTADDRQKATSVAREVVEAAKSMPYRDVAPGTIVTRLRADASIAGTSASPWRIEREGTAFTVQADVCWVDEPADRLGSRAGGGFCEGSGTGGTIDSNPIDFKRVTVTVSWGNGSGKGSVRQSTLISGRGGEDAPAVESVRLINPLESPITSSAMTSAQFAVATASNATAVVWSVDGTQQGSASGSGRNWTLIWQLPPDGTYDVAAQTIESTGRLGEPRSMTVVLNRFLPAAPEGFRAGRNGDHVEAEWSASPERDVVGYRVYRQGSGSATLACESVTETSCVDTAAPAATGGVLDYWIVAVERMGSTEREGEASPRADVNGHNRPPNAPSALTLSKDAQGHTVLHWTAPAAPDPDAGDHIASYRIYRDGTDVTHRLAIVGGTETTLVDDSGSGATHQYWVTSVDTHLSESAPLGPVTG